MISFRVIHQFFLIVARQIFRNYEDFKLHSIVSLATLCLKLIHDLGEWIYHYLYISMRSFPDAYMSPA